MQIVLRYFVIWVGSSIEMAPVWLQLTSWQPTAIRHSWPIDGDWLYRCGFAAKINSCHIAGVISSISHKISSRFGGIWSCCEMTSFWGSVHNWLYRKLSFWQLSAQPMLIISSKCWGHFLSSVYGYNLDLMILYTVLPCFALIWLCNKLTATSCDIFYPHTSGWLHCQWSNPEGYG